MYTISQFAGFTLPTGLTEYTLTPVPAQLNLVQTAAGVFDNDGASRRRQAFPHPLSYKTTVTEDTLAANRTVLDRLRAAVGTQAKLYRIADDNGAVQYCTAILEKQPHTRPYQLRTHIFEITLEFQQVTPWLGELQGAGWKLDSGVLLDDGRVFDEVGPQSLTTTKTNFTRPNDGNYPCHDVIIQVFAGATDLTAISIWNQSTQCYLRWTGLLPAAGQLHIDAAACLVLNNGFDDFNNFQLYELFHRNQYWMEFAPGNNAIEVTRTGGDSYSTINFLFDDTWA